MAPEVVRQLIRRGLADRRLPRDHTIELWRGASLGQICDGCGLSIATNENMSLICAADWKTIRFHTECFEMWNAEKSRYASPKAS